MADYGLTAAGFAPKRLSDIVESLNSGMVAIFGDNSDTDPDSPDGQIIGLFAGALAEVWEAVDEVATIFDPTASNGTTQSKQVRLNGITRGSESRTTVTAEVTGVNPFILGIGSVATTTGGDRFTLDESLVFTGSPQTSAWTAEEVGAVPCGAGTLTTIATPRHGWTAITNAAAASSVGALEESDGDLRRRRERSTEIGAVSIYSAMLAGVSNVASVTDALVLWNETGSTDSLGLPAHSFRAVVEGGADDDIAQAVWDKHPMGIERSGAESGNATDSNGSVIAIAFGRPVYVDIHVEMTITTTANFPSGGADLIKQAIVDYASGQLVGYEGDEYGIGHDAEFSRLYIAVNSIPGHTVDTMFIGLATSPTGVVNLAITDLQKSAWSTSRITVN